MKIAMIIVRTLLGLLFVFSGIAYFFMPMPELKGDMKTFMDGMQASHYLLPFIKLTELVCGVAFVTGFFVPLATVMIFPVVLNIALFNGFVAPQGLPMGVIILLANLFLAYGYRQHYKPLLAAK